MSAAIVDVCAPAALTGVDPAPAMSLDESSRQPLRALLRQQLATAPGAPIVFGARAWAARGDVARVCPTPTNRAHG